MRYTGAASVRLLLTSLVLLLSACRNEPVERTNLPLTDEQLIDINRELVIKEQERIENYIQRKGLEMQMSEAGIWYFIEKEGSGNLLRAGDRVVLEYTCDLLDGTRCYSSAENGALLIDIGKTDIASGLDQALRMLKPGAEATLILPSNMAFGLLGDGDKIPARSALVYSIKVNTQ